MKEIDTKTAVNILRQCSVVCIEGQFVTPIILDLEEDYSNEFVYLSWSEIVEGEEYDFAVSFKEGDNQICLLDKNELTMVNSEGEEEVLELHREWFPE